MKLFSVVTISAMLVTLAACEGGGGRKVAGKQCPSNHAPISMKLVGNQTEISLDPAAKQLVPGTYTYQGSTAFYKDKSNSTTPYMMEITDAKEKNTQRWKAVATCVRNAKAGLNLGFSSQVVRTLEVGAAPDLKTFFETREISVTLAGSFKVNSTDGQQKVEDIPSKAYEKLTTPAKLMMVKKSDTDFEIRAHYADPQGAAGQGELWVVTRLKRANLPAKKP